MIKIIVDAMGGDYAPYETVKGALQSLSSAKNFKLVLTGDEALIQHELNKYRYDASRVEIVHCTEVITGDDVPTSAVRAKRDSSLVVGLKMLKEDEETAGFVSAGSTGALLTGAIMYVGRIKGVMRPALCPVLPNVRGTTTMLCDCGANAECRPAYLVQFGVMAAAYAKAAYGVEDPRVGLVSNGTEEHKGDPLHQEAYELFKSAPVNFVGNVEGRDIMYGDIDVAVTDGFSGNVALKAMEGLGKTVLDTLKKEFSKSFGRKIGYLFARKSLKGLKGAIDYNAVGGSVFLGVKKPVVKAHGASKAQSICASVRQVLETHRGNLIPLMTKMLEETEQQA